MLHITLGCAFLVAAMTTALVAQTPPQAVVAGRNVNMVSGTTWPTGDPFLQRQNEPSVAVSTRNPLHMLAGANDYRSVELPGLIDDTETGDAWLGIFKSFDGGLRWQSTLLPGYQWLGPKSSPLYGYAAAADPVVRAGGHGLFFYGGLVFNRGTETTPGKSAVFVSRYIDNNNLETGDPIAYIGTSVVVSNPGTTGRFLDKPWIAVDIPRSSSSTCRVVTPGPPSDPATPVVQVIPASIVYAAYTAITYVNGQPQSAEIFLSRSIDCGATWSVPVRVSRPQDPLNQGASIAINPVNGDVYVAWRRLTSPGATDSDAYLVARSTNQGRKFSNPGVARRFPRGKKKGLSLERYFEHRKMTEAHEVLNVAEFDQGTSADWVSFRTNAYPTLTFDGEGRLYLAWSERGFGAARPGDVEGDARIVMTTTRDGLVFTPPQAADDSAVLPGHQIMPTLTFANGRLLLVYYDLREDVSGVFSPYIDDKSAINSANRRHSIDIRATTAAPADEPAFALSTQVSDYARGTGPGETGPPRQLQLNVPNLPIFKQGTVPFIGDYIDVAAAPSMVQGSDGRWQFNTAAGAAPVFHGVWTDNRDVKPPVSRIGGKPDWSQYTKPGFPATVCEAGTRNQNIYTARLTTGLLAGSPGNTKPLTMAFPRSFVVYAQNTTEQLKYFRLTIANQPAGGRASFLEYPLPPYTNASPPPLTQLDVAVPRRSLVARTVYATSTDPHARIDVSVAEIAAVGAPAPLPDGLRAAVVLNPDIENPDIENPDIENPDIENPDIENAEVHNPDIENAIISNPDIENPDIENPDIENPDIENPDIENYDLSNPDIENPDIENPDIENPDIENPDIENPDIENGTITDVTWTVTNKGNTTTAFDVKLFFSTLTDVPDGVALQLILYRVYKTPLANGCDLKEQTHNVLVSNIVNPDIENPDIENAPVQAVAARSASAPQEAAATDPKTPTLWIEPGGVAKITLRIYDKDRTDANKLDPTEIAPEIKAQPKNTEDLPDTSKEPPSATPKPAPDVPLLAFAAQPVAAPAGDTLPEVVVSVSSGAAGVPVALAFADNPAGADLTGTTIVETDGAGLAHFINLQLTKEGAGFRLAASATSIDAVPVLSEPFTVDPPSTIVRNTNNSGLGSLRQAILNANALPGADVITFNIPAGPFTIAPASALPVITDPLTIDGTTQPGYAGAPVVELNGAGAGASVHGLYITAGSSTVRGLAINRFTGWGIAIDAIGANVVERNHIGTNAAGTAPGPGNVTGGVVVVGSDGSAIRQNVVSGNGGTGVWLGSATAGTFIQGNYIGTNAAGTTALPNNKGIEAAPGAGGPTIGGLAAADRNVISGNTIFGIGINQNVTGTLVQGNYIGTDGTGTASVGNGRGIVVFGTATTIGGLVPAARNVISGNTGLGIEFGSTGTGNFVWGNYIGVDQTGSSRLANGGNGVYVSATASGNYIGGALAGAGNVVSGNLWTGVMVYGSGNFVQGNLVGLNATGTAAVPNGDATHTAFGIHVDGGASNLIGGTVAAARNVVSGNRGNGIYVTGAGATGNFVQGNYIGLNALGTIGVPNGARGVMVSASNNTIGGADPAARNVISGNTFRGVEIAGDIASPATDNVLQGNYIGLDWTGTLAVANGGDGVAVVARSKIGGDVPGAGNVISGNTGDGIIVGSSGSFIQGNLVGVNAAGSAAVPNGGSGIYVLSSGNTIGASTPAAARNVVAYNLSQQILIASGTGNSILSNSVIPPAGSGRIGIDLGLVGATPNDPLDADTGANGLQNNPELAWADNGIYAGQTMVQFSFNSKPSTQYTVEFFANAICDPTTPTAERVARTMTVLTDSSGNAVTISALINPAIPPGGGVTATATGPDGTSELSACVPVINGTPLNFAVLNTNDSGPGSLRRTMQDADSHPGADNISFAIPGSGPFTIALSAALPPITGPVTIDGWTQPGHTTGGPPVVEVRGNDTITEGFSVSGSGTTIRGLVINAFGYGISANASSNLWIEGNYVGTDRTGTTRVPNRLGGVFIWNSTNATVVGNLISGQGTIGLPARVDGIQISGCSGTRIQRNRIGTNAAATAALGNAGFGVIISGAGTANTEITDNVISGNPFGGISIQMGAHGTIVQSNKIGTGTDTSVEIGNGKPGFVDGGGINLSNSPDNTIGSELPAGMNTIAHNFGPGVFGYGAASTGNRILGNAIWHNGGMGIDLWGDYGVTANSDPETIGRQNFPVITSAHTTGGTTLVAGTLTSKTGDSFRVEVFSNASCDWAGGNGEGAHLMGSFIATTDVAGNATFSEAFPSLPIGNVLTATATRWSAGGGTSEFSGCYTIPAAPITFAGLTTHGSPVTTYTESWFTVTTDSPDWVASTSYGAPAPFIIFSAPAGTTLTREIHVTAAGSPFSFLSVDLYSSTTPIPYEIKGLRNSAEVFSMTGTIPNTFGLFRTLAHPTGLDIIDTLVIKLSNPAALCCSNPMGLDNIVLRER